MLRRYTGRWQAGIVTIVAARPAMGKSSLLLATADACSAASLDAHLFSLEDTRRHTRIGRSRARAMSLRRTANARLDRGGCDRIVPAQMRLRGRRWIVDGAAGSRPTTSCGACAVTARTTTPAWLSSTTSSS
jgi:DnaB-like helicase C terminal domain